MNIAYLLIGGNIGNREENLIKAIFLIEQNCGKVIAKSSIYETAAWGNEQQPDFLNQVIKIETILEPTKLLENILQIENKMGRIRSKINDPRTIDIDILLFNKIALTRENLTIPHPRLHLRKFVLIPLAEIANNLIHPVLKESIGDLLKKCTDTLYVKKFLQ